MFKRILAICGLVLFLGSVGLGLYLAIGDLRASALTSPHIPECGVDVLCSFSPGYGYLKLNNSNQTISVNETDALTITFDYVPRPNDPQSAPMTITLLAPEFNINPGTSEKTVPFSGYITLGWVLIPTQPGTFQVGIQVEAPAYQISDIQYIGITVTNVFGLSPWQIQLLSYIFTFLGPLLSAAWWYDKWKEHKRKKRSRAPPTSVQPTTQNLQGPIGKFLAGKRQKNQ